MNSGGFSTRKANLPYGTFTGIKSKMRTKMRAEKASVAMGASIFVLSLFISERSSCWPRRIFLVQLIMSFTGADILHWNITLKLLPPSDAKRKQNCRRWSLWRSAITLGNYHDCHPIFCTSGQQFDPGFNRNPDDKTAYYEMGFSSSWSMFPGAPRFFPVFLYLPLRSSITDFSHNLFPLI